MELDSGAFGSSGGGGGASKQDVEYLKSLITSTVFQVKPTEGATVVAPFTASIILVIEVTPAADLAALTIRLPDSARSTTGQRVFVHTTKQIDQLRFVSDGTVDNWMMSVSPGDCVDFTKSNSTTWSRST